VWPATPSSIASDTPCPDTGAAACAIADDDDRPVVHRGATEIVRLPAANSRTGGDEPGGGPASPSNWRIGIASGRPASAPAVVGR
jgi:hypothetical protein